MTFQATCQKLLDRYVSCYRAGDAAGCASVYAPDAELYSPFGPPAIGRDAIRVTHEDWVRESAGNKELTVLSAGQSGDMGWCVARFSEGATGTGISVNVLARPPQGDWKITHCSLNDV